MTIYIDNGDTVKIYPAKVKVVKAIETLLELDDNLYWSETARGYGVEVIYKAKSEDKKSCDNCKNNTDSWDSDACDGCCGNHSRFEPQESKTDMSGEISREEIAALLARESEEQV